MQMEGQTRVQTVADGGQAVVRLGRQNELIMNQAGGTYYEPTYRGQVFVMDSDAVTLAAANTTKGAAATIKFVNGFLNPANSLKNAVIIKCTVATVSGTPAGGYFYNAQACAGGVTNAATGTIRNCFLGGATSAMTAETGVVLVRSDAATTAFTQIASLGGPTAVAATGAVESIQDYADGTIIVPPGYLFGVAATAAGTSHVVQSTLIWHEVPV